MTQKFNRRYFTSESVTEGHPDKVCDQISDAILDDILSKDPLGRVACEVVVTTGLVMVMGEITTSCYVDIPKVVRQTISEIGYHNQHCGFDAETCGVINTVKEQSPDISCGVDSGGAGDQGMMFGYACNETPELMPLPISLAHRLAQKLAEVRKSGLLPYLRPDGKTQVTVEYDEKQNPLRIDTVLISTQHTLEVSQEQIARDLLAHVIQPVIPAQLLDHDTRYLTNPTGIFCIGGPEADSGLTGRKIIVDTYGGYSRHGGGSFSGKDPTKVDRSAAYATRHAAKNIVAAGLADRCELQLAYAIGVADPVSVYIDTFDTHKIPMEELYRKVVKTFNFQPGAIIDYFGLRSPIYRKIAAYGHFGRTDLDLPWEKLDKVEELKNA
jgi:S-adenosylmethionine synthetase